MQGALSCLQDRCDIKENCAEAERLPSSHMSTCDIAQGFW